MNILRLGAGEVSDLRNFWPVNLWRRFWGPKTRIGILRLEGSIGGIGVGSFSFAAVEPILERMFEHSELRAVAILINSPGGAAVQSKLIAERIRHLSDESGIPVFMFIEDIGASGGYMIALAGDEIFADSMSLIGSIGVISAGFGFHDLIRRFGVERRVLSAGARKAALDPFLPQDPDAVTRFQRLLSMTHDDFVAMVKARRAEALRAPDDVLFNADIWTGREAKELGLIDGIGEVRTVLRARYGKRMRVKRFALRSPNALSFLGLSMGQGFGHALADRILSRHSNGIDAM